MRPLLISSLLFFCFNAFTQNLDLIVTTKGDSLACKIDSVTATKIFVHQKYKNKWLGSYYPASQIKSYKRNCIDSDLYRLTSNSEIIRLNPDKYRYLKTKFSAAGYHWRQGDRFSPQLAATASILMPGLGQVYAGEPLTGLAYWGGTAASVSIFGVGFIKAWEGSSGAGTYLLTGMISATIIYVSNIVNAVKIAKVKSLAARDNQLSFSVSPQIEFKNVQQPFTTCGVGMAISF